MCMWQSHAFAGALSLGGSVPDENGTASAWALRTDNPDTAATAATVAPLRNSRRCMASSHIGADCCGYWRDYRRKNRAFQSTGHSSRLAGTTSGGDLPCWCDYLRP